MKKVIGGKVYDTATARELGYYEYSNRGDFGYYREVLYQKRTGEFFLYGEGGGASRYAQRVEQSGWGWGERVIPLAIDAAREWVEKHLDGEDYERIFGLPDEGDRSVTAISANIPAALVAAARNRAATEGTTVTAIIAAALRQYLQA